MERIRKVLEKPNEKLENDEKLKEKLKKQIRN